MIYRLYKITNLINGKQYIGLTEKTLTRRWERHRAVKRNTVMHLAITKYGADAFTIEEICQAGSLDEAAILERAFIAEYGTFWPNGYNMTPGGEGRGGPRNATSRALMRENWRAWWEDLSQSEKDARIAHLVATRPPQSPESLEKSRLNRIGLKRTDEFRARMRSIAQKRTYSDETRAKMSASQLMREGTKEKRRVREEEYGAMTEKVCSRCKKCKPIEAFEFNTRIRD